jgi:hypothetical protein
MTNNKFKYAGISMHGNKYKVRFAQNTHYGNVLIKRGDKNVKLVPLPMEMTKQEIVEYFRNHEFYDNPDYRHAIDKSYFKYHFTEVEKEERKQRKLSTSEQAANLLNGIGYEE